MTIPTDKPTISFVVTALNEEKFIEPTVFEILTAAGGFFSDFEILLIDDASTDRTPQIMDELAAGNPKIRAIHNPKNLGMGGAYKRGVEVAKFEYVMLVPGDNSIPAKGGLANIFSRIGQADILITYSLNPSIRPWFRRVGSAGFTALMNFLFGLKVRYYNGFVVHQTRILRKITIISNDFAYQAEALVKLLKQGYSHSEVGVLINERKGGKTKAFQIKNLTGVVRTILRLTAEIKK